MDFSHLLNNKQLEAVETTSKNVRVIAGAGSGKTRVLTYRIAYLISEQHVSPSNILAITFTNKVANEMKERALNLIEENYGYRPFLRISTFHSFCAFFLRQEAKLIGFPSSFTIYDEDDTKKLIKNIGEELGYSKGSDEVKAALKFISYQKERGLYPSDINPKNLRTEQDKISLKFFTRYEEEKDKSFALDFDDLLLKTNQILDNYPDVQERWSHKYTHVLIDEFQDTNDVQYKLLKLLVNPEASLYVVGDPDQTIYTWRGANQKIILDFDRNYKDTETIILNENYRSTKTILDAANKLIEHNKERVKKDLFTNGEQGAAIETIQESTDDKEARWVVKKIKEIGINQKDKEGKPQYNNIAVLYRSSYLTRPFEQALKDYGINYRIFGGLRFYERMEVKDLISYCYLMVNPKDNISFERIVNVPRRGIGDTSLITLKKEADAQNVSELEYALDIEKYKDTTDLAPRVVRALTIFSKNFIDTRKELQDGDEAYSAILRRFVTKIGYFDYLKDMEDIEEDRIGNVEALFNDIDHYFKDNPGDKFENYLQNVTLLTSQDDLEDGNYVSLMTVHVAKGLEFDYVFVIGLEDGVFPSDRTIEESDKGMEEERRLAYVSFTRAKKKLFLSCNSSYSFKRDTNLSPSPFFKEAGLKVTKPYGFKTDAYQFKGWSDRDMGYERQDVDTFDTYRKNVNVVSPKKQTNGVIDWKVGDHASHIKFGEGVVIKLQGNDIILVDFKEHGIKTLLGTHPSLTKIYSKGGQA